MPQQHFHQRKFTNSLLAAGFLLLQIGCQNRPSQSPQTLAARTSKKSDSSFLVAALADSLNNLPSEVVVELKPPFPVLDDAKSADGQPVLAACGVTPEVPDGPYNYLYVPAGNGNFSRLGIRPGDVVRYFTNVDQDSVAHGITQVNYFELIVRRLDTQNSQTAQNALIVEGSLNQPVPPQAAARIEIWRFSDKRTNEIRKRLNRYLKKPSTLIGWEPSPEESALAQLLERANQWLRSAEKQESTWQPEPLTAELADAFLNVEPLKSRLSVSGMQSGPFLATEARQFQQAIWLRDVSRWAKGEAVSPPAVAQALFDWTIRNVQLDPPALPGYVHQPWQALMYGHGTAEQRAWIFAELCRQQQLDVVMLATGNRFWLPAFLHDEKLYLFDTRLGLPMPASAPGQVATLAEVVENPQLLSNLDLGDELKYPITASDLQQLTAWLVASPLQLSRRAFRLEQALEGNQYVVLSADTQRLAKLLATHPNLTNKQLWPYPFESLLAERTMSRTQRFQARNRFEVFASRPRLWKARILHFQGTKEIPIEDRNDPLAQPDRGHQQATALYQDPRIRPPNKLLAIVPPAKRALYQTAKGDASYWLGLLSYDLGKYFVAQDWLARRTLAATPQGPWTTGAVYNLSRTEEALGNLSVAIQLLEADQSPQRHGNLLRARQLKQQLEAEAEKDNSSESPIR